MAELLRLSNSSFKTVLRCEQKYTYKYVMNLRPKMAALPLKLGSWVHLLLEAKYKLGDWRKLQEKLAREYDRLFDEEKQLYGDLPAQTNSIMVGYDWHYRHDDEEWDVLETEKKIELPLNPHWEYVAKLDVVAENDDGIWVWDHKTFRGKSFNPDYRTLDPQSALYDWAYERLTGIKPVGFVFNFIRTKLPTIPRLLKSGGLSRAKNIDTNWVTLMLTLKHYGLSPKLYREELAAARARNKSFYDRVYVPKPLSVIKNLLLDVNEKLPIIRALHEGRRPTRSLTPNCRYDCEFHLLCLTELTGGDSTYIKKHDFVERAWDEYEDDPVVSEIGE